MADRERILGPDHPDTLFSRGNLATAHQEAGDVKKAIALFQARSGRRAAALTTWRIALKAAAEHLGDDHPVAQSLRSRTMAPSQARSRAARRR